LILPRKRRNPWSFRERACWMQRACNLRLSELPWDYVAEWAETKIPG